MRRTKLPRTARWSCFTFVSMLSERGVTIPVLHCSNSAGILELRRRTLTRSAGNLHYGLYPSDEVEKEPVRLIPAMELKSTITYLKTIAPGTPGRYGTFTSRRDLHCDYPGRVRGRLSPGVEPGGCPDPRPPRQNPGPCLYGSADGGYDGYP